MHSHSIAEIKTSNRCRAETRKSANGSIMKSQHIPDKNFPAWYSHCIGNADANWVNALEEMTV